MPSKSVADRIAAALLAASIAAPSIAQAEPSAADKAQADALFQDGRRLMAAKKYDEACRKLAESQRLDPAGGTLLNLAVCHELAGKIATAWVEFNDALADARQEKRNDRIELAKKHIAALEPKLPKLTVLVGKDSQVPGLKIEHDGALIHDAAWGTPIPVDPGILTISAAAPGRKRWENKIRIDEGETRAIAIPQLDVDDTAQPSAPKEAPKTDEHVSTAHASRRTLAFVAGGVGVVALGVGGYFGLRTLSRKSDSDAHCPTATTCDAEGVAANDDAHRAAWIADAGVGLGLIGVGVGAYLLLTGDEKPSGTEARVHVVPQLGPGVGGVSLGGAF